VGGENGVYSRLVIPDGGLFGGDNFRTINRGGSGTVRFVSEVEKWGLDFSPDGQVLAAGINGESLILYRYSDAQQIATLRVNRSGIMSSNEVQCLDFSPDGQTLATCSDNGIIKMWRAEEQ
jgi:WD40 repeat protein